MNLALPKMKSAPPSNRRHIIRAAALLLSIACVVPVLSAAPVPSALRPFTSESDTGALIPALQAQLRAADAAARSKLEIALLAVATDAEATVEGREAACTVLAGFASEAAIAPLAPLLSDSALSRSARFILDRMPGAAVNRAFLHALEDSSGETKLGIINSLAVRRMANAVNPLSRLARGTDATVAAAAIHALGEIGDLSAFRVVNSLGTVGPLARARNEAILCAVSHLIEAGKRPKDLLSSLEKLREEGDSPGVRAAAWHLLLKTEPGHAFERITGLLASEDGELPRTGAQSLRLLALPEVADRLVALAAGWSTESKAMLIEQLSGAGLSSALPLARTGKGSDDPYLQQVSIDALGRLGDASDLDVLFQLAAAEADTRPAALAAIVELTDPAVDTRLLGMLAEAAAPSRHDVPELLTNRMHRAAVPALLELGPGAERTFATEIYKAIGALGEAGVIPRLLEQWAQAAGPKRSAIERAIVAIGRNAEEGVVTRQLTPWFSAPNDTMRTSAVRMIGAIGDMAALDALTPFVVEETPDPNALRALLAWKSAEAIPVLESLVVRNELKESTRRSAWQSLLRVSEKAFRSAPIASLRGFQTCMLMALEGTDRPQVVDALAKLEGDEVRGMLRGWLLIPGAAHAAEQALAELE